MRKRHTSQLSVAPNHWPEPSSVAIIPRKASSGKGIGHTLQRTEATVHDQLQIAQLALGEHNGGQLLRLSGQLIVAGSIAGDEVLQDTTMGGVGHCWG